MARRLPISPRCHFGSASRCGARTCTILSSTSAHLALDSGSVLPRFQRQTDGFGAHLTFFLRKGSNAARLKKNVRCALRPSSGQEFDDGLGAGVDMELLINVSEMFPNGIDADAKLVGDFLVKAALGQKFQNLLLTRG